MGTIGENIGGKIRKLREAKGWSQAELANELGLTYKYVSKLEVGDRNPSRATVAKLAVLRGLAEVLARRAPPDAVAMALWELLRAAGYGDADIVEIAGMLRKIE